MFLFLVLIFFFAYLLQRPSTSYCWIPSCYTSCYHLQLCTSILYNKIIYPTIRFSAYPFWKILFLFPFTWECVVICFRIWMLAVVTSTARDQKLWLSWQGWSLLVTSGRRWFIPDVICLAAAAAGNAGESCKPMNWGMFIRMVHINKAWRCLIHLEPFYIEDQNKQTNKTNIKHLLHHQWIW